MTVLAETCKYLWNSARLDQCCNCSL